MDVKQEQDPFELASETVIPTGQTNQNNYCPSPKMFKNEHGDITEQFAHIDKIKEEMIECEMPKIEQSLDLLPTKIEQDAANLHSFPNTIKQELENTSHVEVTDIKQEVSEYIQTKTESVVSELLSSHCDLPTLKVESTDYSDYLGPTSSRKSLKNTAQVILKKKKRYACPICQKNFPSKSISAHIDGHFEKRYAVCQFCGRVMKKIEFFQHLFIHLVKNRIKNSINDESLKRNLSSKKLNLKNIDVDDKSFKCGTCFKTFNQKSNLRRHLVIHSDEKPFKCDICSKGYNYQYSFQEHVLIHIGEKPFQCHFCSKGFYENCDLQRHILIHTEKPFKCDICFKCFNRKSTLRKHLIIHSVEKPFKCEKCPKSFNFKSNLKQHVLNHSAKELFKCDICSKGFNLKSVLKRHLVFHSSEKPFICNSCSKGFKQKSCLQRHLKIHLTKTLKSAQSLQNKS